jgi:hypothetical protein
MKTFQRVLAMLAVLIVGAQTLRHVYVRYIEPRQSVLDRFDPTRQNIAASKSLDELVTLYETAWKKVEEEDKTHPATTEESYDYRRAEREPYKSEVQLKQAITEWEDHQRQLYELHFFWWSGFASVVIGAFAYRRSVQWLGMSCVLLGFLEMIWATSPSLSSFGYPIEFERLLTYKIAYSVATFGVVLAAWLAIERHSTTGAPSGIS